MRASVLKGVPIYNEHILLLQEPVKGLPSLAPKKKKAESEAATDKQTAAAE